MGQQGCEGILSCEEFLHLVQLLLHLEDYMAGVKVYLDAKKKTWFSEENDLQTDGGFHIYLSV